MASKVWRLRLPHNQALTKDLSSLRKHVARSVAEFAKNFGRDRSKALAASATTKSNLL